MKLTHLGISQFRSIGGTPVIINLEKKITVLVGQNDCGKSNVLRGLEWVSQLRSNGKWREHDHIDKHNREPDGFPFLHFKGVPGDEDSAESRIAGGITLRAPVYPRFEQESESAEIHDLDTRSTVQFAQQAGINSWEHHPDEEKLKRMKQDIIRHVAGRLRANLVKFAIIPQYRRIENTDSYAIDGKGIVKLLASWQVPEDGSYHLRSKFDHVQAFLRRLIERPSVILEVPPSHKEILVRDGDLRLPLESHGTGIHQLIILAIAVLSEDNAIFGIEETEIHLHPVLQRRFLAFLKEETTNRYVITTHSPTLIVPADDVEVIHLKMVDGVTIPTRVATDKQTLDALDDLGIRASDLLQANSVIWVEGPSDRIYLRRWLELLAPELKEGIDFSIMFYGGRLLAHLTMERDEAEKELPQLIKLLRINQHSALVMDSDRKKSASEPVNATKQRIVEECERNGLHTWVTDGREIENYLTQRPVEAALKEAGLLNGRFELAKLGVFTNSMNEAMIRNPPASSQYDKHKTEWAHRIAPHMEAEDLGVDLKIKLRALAEFIRRRSRAC